MKLFPSIMCVFFGALVAADVLRVTPKLDKLVPTINQQNYKLMPMEDKFSLRLDFPEGGTRKEETELLVDKNGKEVLAVKGRLDLVYNNIPLYVTVIYEADENGYRASYMYVPKQATTALFASASFLKTATG